MGEWRLNTRLVVKPYLWEEGSQTAVLTNPIQEVIDQQRAGLFDGLEAEA